ncbi:hypothetical protein C8R44DRAFT_891680 [Mycena epipterygia]|nr:hypothetical protein C8R44DRAFT_891680 [Mycena epipterygia]
MSTTLPKKAKTAFTPLPPQQRKAAKASASSDSGKDTSSSDSGKASASSGSDKDTASSGSGKASASSGSGKDTASSGSGSVPIPEKKKGVKKNKGSEPVSAPFIHDKDNGPLNMKVSELFAAHTEQSKLDRKQSKKVKTKKALNPVLPAVANNQSGPQLVSGPFQRYFMKKNAVRLFKIGFQGLRREDPKTALVYMVDPALIDSESYTKNIKGPFPLAVWEDGANQDIIEEIGGQHRLAAFKMHLGTTLERLEAVEKALSKSISETRIAELEGEKDQLREVLMRDECSWLVALYDKALNTDQDNQQAIMLDLSTNNTLQAEIDSPEHHFNSVLMSLRCAKTSKDREAVKQVVLALQTDVTTLVQKHKDVLSIYTDLNYHELFAQNTLLPKELLESKETFWGILELFITGGLRQLEYLASPLDLPMDHGQDTWAMTILTLLEQDGILFNGDMVAKLIEFSEKAFIDHLADQMCFFGQIGSEAWNKSFLLYQASLGTECTDWVDKELKKTNLPRQDRKTYTYFSLKLKAVLHSGYMSAYPFLPPMDCKIPFLCPTFVQKLFAELKEMAPGLTLIASWFVPGLTDTQRSTKKGTNIKTHHDSAVEAIKTHMEYFQHQNTKMKGFEMQYLHNQVTKVKGFEWAYTEPVGVGEITFPNNKYSASIHLNIQWFQLIAHLLQSRTTALLGVLTPITIALEQKPTKKELGLTKNVLAPFLGIMGHWANDSLLAAKARCTRKSEFLVTHNKLRLLQKCPIKVVQDQADFVESPFTDIVLKALGLSNFNWFVTPDNNNNKDMQQRYLRCLWSEGYHHALHLAPLVHRSPQLYLLRGEILDIIQATPGLESYETWYDVEEPEQEVVKLVYKDRLLIRLAGVVARQNNTRKMDTLFNTFLKGLASNGICGVPIPLGDKSDKTKFVLHPALDYPLHKLYDRLELVLDDCSSVATGRPKYEWSEFPQNKSPQDWSQEPEVHVEFATYEQQVEYNNKLSPYPPPPEEDEIEKESQEKQAAGASKGPKEGEEEEDKIEEEQPGGIPKSLEKEGEEEEEDIVDMEMQEEKTTGASSSPREEEDIIEGGETEEEQAGGASKRQREEEDEEEIEEDEIQGEQEERLAKKPRHNGDIPLPPNQMANK